MQAIRGTGPEMRLGAYDWATADSDPTCGGSRAAGRPGARR